MHIAQALAALNLGGSELVALELSEYIASHNLQASIIAANGPLEPRVRDSGATYLEWAIGRKRLTTLRYIKKLATWLKEQKVAVLHAHSRLPAWICWRALRHLSPAQRPAFVTTMHGHYSVNAYSAVMTRGDAVLAVSDHMRNYTLENYSHVDPDKVITVHGGINHSSFPHGYRPDKMWLENMAQRFPETVGKKLISLPGRLSRWKGHREFIKLLARIRAKRDSVHGLIIGGGNPNSSYGRELKELAEQENMTHCLSFTGETTQIRNWMAVSDLVLNLSHNPPEALGRTVIEALSLGRPVLAWDHGGAGEILDRTFPEGKVPLLDMDALTTRAVEMLENPPLVPETDSFGLDVSMQKHLEIYQRLDRNRLC
jgi:glycosyltransferase involved in cell wall biosynthesis